MNPWSEINSDKPTPVGCLVGVFALAALVLGALGLLVAWRARDNDKLEPETISNLVWWGGGAVIAGIAGLCVAARLIGAFIDKGPPPDRGGLH